MMRGRRRPGRAGVQRGDERTIVDRPWFAIAASLLYAFGWLLVPGGWLIGAVAVLFCSSWTSAEKRRALAIPVIAAAVLGSGVGLSYGLSGTPSSSLTTWTAVGAAVLARGAASVVLGVGLCARTLRRAAVSARRTTGDCAGTPAPSPHDVS
jgi:hypothetical protein